MADNYLERQYEEYLRRKDKAAADKRRKWQQQLKKYKESLKDNRS